MFFDVDDVMKKIGKMIDIDKVSKKRREDSPIQQGDQRRD